MFRRLVFSKLHQRAVLAFFTPKLNHARAVHITGVNMSCEANQQTLMVTRMLQDFLVSSEVQETQKGGLSRPPAISEPEIVELCSHYKKLDKDARIEFLQAISQKCGVDHNAIHRICKNINQQYEKGEGAMLQAESKLHQALTPHYSRLFHQISRTSDGVKFLMDLRADILDILSDRPANDHYLRALNQTLKEMLSHWFSAGLLTLQLVTWQSSCEMLQKISDYEAVIPVRSWLDLKQRVGPYRRCFVFTHSAIPTEPIMVLHCALMKDIPTNLQDIIGNRLGMPSDVSETTKDETEDTENTQAAIFYSISSTQPGLKGVDLGNYLIKSVVQRFRRDFPQMTKFCTMSPIPGFKDWLTNEIVKTLRGSQMVYPILTKEELETLQELSGKPNELPLQTLKRLLVTSHWLHSDKMVEILKEPLMRLCARYLYTEKHRGHALDPVANFHLHNGATVWRLNWLADTSPRGMSQSCGMMCNYRYFLDTTIKNSRIYTETRHIEAEKQILDLVDKCGVPVAGSSDISTTKSHL